MTVLRISQLFSLPVGPLDSYRPIYSFEEQRTV